MYIQLASCMVGTCIAVDLQGTHVLKCTYVVHTLYVLAGILTQEWLSQLVFVYVSNFAPLLTSRTCTVLGMSTSL